MPIRLKIAMIGTRGIPANYGGFETCVQEIGKRLSKKGHEVTVYCRKSYYNRYQIDEYMGMKRVVLPNISKKSIDTFSHTFFSVFHALFQNYDIYMVFNAANSIFLFPLKFLNKKIAINTDGLEWQRSKWGVLGRFYYKASEKLACIAANRIISDSRGIKDYYMTKHGTDSTEIAYGAYIQNSTRNNIITELGLEPNKYFLQITRFEPENYPLLTIKAYKRLTTDKKLVLVGGNPYPNDYTRAIEKEANENIFLPGFIYDQELLRELWCNCFAYIHGNSVGGTNPALLQTMASGCFTIASDVIFNRDVLGDCGVYFKDDVSDLSKKMSWALNNKALDIFKNNAIQRIKEYYDWDRISSQYEELFFDLYKGKY